MRNIRIGDYLVEQKLITQEQLMEVLAKQKEPENTGRRFGEMVVELGFISEISLSKALAAKLRGDEKYSSTTIPASLPLLRRLGGLGETVQAERRFYLYSEASYVS